MTAAGRLLRQARRAQSLTQRQLADLVELRQPALASIESGAHDPGSERLERAVTAAGHRLAVLPTRAHTVSDIADAIFVALRNRDRERAFRLLVQLNDDLASEHGAVRVALAVTPPAPVGDVRYDAYVAAIVEHYLTKDGLPVPEWVRRPERVLSEPWRLDRTAGPELEASTPPAFRRHGVFIDAAELASV